MELINQIEDDGHTCIINTQIVQILDQVSASKINLRIARLALIAAWCQPASFEPRVQRFIVDPGLEDKFTRFHN
jgi:hypothetical protein